MSGNHSVPQAVPQPSTHCPSALPSHAADRPGPEIRRRLKRGVQLIAALTLSGVLLSSCGPLVRSTYPAASLTTQATVTAPTQIYLDALGVPHIFAQNDDDAAYAIGFLHGRDRRFQLELIRHASQGRLTELLGKSMLDTDRRLRILTLRLEEVLSKLAASDRQRLESYCAGINEAQKTWPLPLELKLLGHTPSAWTPLDVIAVGRFQAWDLSTDADLEATRDVLASATPPETLLWLITPSLHLGVPIMDGEQVRRSRPPLPTVPATPEGTLLDNDRGQTVAAPSAQESADASLPSLNGTSQLTDAPLILETRSSASAPQPSQTLSTHQVSARPLEKELLTSEGILARDEIARAVNAWLENPIGGSNGWAIAGRLTPNGKPILAGDPHLDLPWPPIFYEVHFHTPEVDVSGSTFPGMPMVVIGRSNDVAWTLTTSYVDTQDLFLLSIDPLDQGRYRVDGEAEAFVQWPQKFTWGKKPEDSVTEDFLISRFGPVYNKGREDRLKPGVTYALSWPGFAGEGLPITRSFDAVYRAKTPEAMQAAIEMLPVPSQNWVYATASGHIGYVLGGAIPDRRASPLPRDGSTAASSWMGMMSNAQRPVLVDPPSGYVVASNQPLYSDVARLNTQAGGNYRSLRIATALEARSSWTTQAVRGMQVDTVNLEAARFVPILKQAFESHYPKNLSDDRLKRITLMASLLGKWDYAMRPDAPEALLYESWRQHVHRRLFGRHIQDKALLERYLKSRMSEAAMEVAFFSSSGQDWWDDRSTPVLEKRDESLVLALADAEAELVQKLGPDTASWTWGKLHVLTPKHPFAAKSYLKPIFGIDPIPAQGGRHTLIALSHEGVLGNYAVTSGAAMRQVVQPGVEAGYVLAGGNAGQPRHPNAVNQLEDWLQGHQHVAGGTEEYWKEHAKGVIVLKP